MQRSMPCTWRTNLQPCDRHRRFLTPKILSPTIAAAAGVAYHLPSRPSPLSIYTTHLCVCIYIYITCIYIYTHTHMRTTNHLPGHPVHHPPPTHATYTALGRARERDTEREPNSASRVFPTGQRGPGANRFRLSTALVTNSLSRISVKVMVQFLAGSRVRSWPNTSHHSFFSICSGSIMTHNCPMPAPSLSLSPSIPLTPSLHSSLPPLLQIPVFLPLFLSVFFRLLITLPPPLYLPLSPRSLEFFSGVLLNPYLSLFSTSLSLSRSPPRPRRLHPEVCVVCVCG